MDIGIFFNGTPIPYDRLQELLFVFKNTKYDNFYFNDFYWKIALKQLEEKNINLKLETLCKVNIIWDCTQNTEIIKLIKDNPDKIFYEFSTLKMDHHLPKKPNEELNNLFYLVSEITDDKDCKFDLSLLLNYLVWHNDWSYHFHLRETFKLITNKDYRMEFCIYFPFKENRLKYIKHFYKKYDNLLFSINKFHLQNLKNIELLKDTHLYEFYLRLKRDFSDDINYINSFDSNYFVDDFCDGIGGLDHKINFKKFINTTIKSDISILIETDNGEQWDRQKNLVTEKTYDMIMVGKPFISLCKVTDDFIEKFGFINYKKIKAFEGKTELEIIDFLLTLNDTEYTLIKNQLYDIAKTNIQIFDNYIKENTFIEKLINGN